MGGRDMGFLQRLLRRKKDPYMEGFEDELEIEEETPSSLDEIPQMSRAYYVMENPSSRDKFIKECLEQMADASQQVDMVSEEYQEITDYLSDMEIIEDLPTKDAENLLAYAKKIQLYREEEQKFRGNPERMMDADFLCMDRIAREMPEGLDKLYEAEDYQRKVRSDLQRVENERSAYRYRKHELTVMKENMKGISMIIIIAMAISILLLCVLQFVLQLDAVVGYLIVAVAGAVTLIVVYLKYEESSGELEKIGYTTNRLIRLHNKVKIRYVNNTNLLEYLYAKYGVSSARELEKKWKTYENELFERRKQNDSEAARNNCEEELTKLLRKAKLKNADRWLKQIDALVNEQEMKEIRRSLILRRTKLRSQIEYNQKLAEDAQVQIKEAVSEYPQYAEEILEQVNNFELKTRI